MRSRKFTNEIESLRFYEERYTNGYMEDWESSKKRRVLELIKELNLPAAGKALDFGCGNGVLTTVVKAALPAWEIHGCDVSSIAINNAKKNFPDLKFFVHDDYSAADNQFDLIFTHHVLEHVFDIEKSWSEIALYGRSNSIILHILPCGNKNSFEYNHALLFKNGIDHNAGDRFFFEDIGHLRRLTSHALKQTGIAHGYKPFKSYYAHQYYGALDWISHSHEAFITEFFNTESAINEDAEKRINSNRQKITRLVKARRHSMQSISPDLKKAVFFLSVKAVRRIIIRIFFRCIHEYYQRMMKLEWRMFRHRENGSEMFIYFKKEK